MGFPDADLTEQEEIEQLVKDIDDGCCVGEFSETGDVGREEQALFDRDGVPCSDVRTEMLDQLLRDGRIALEEETHPNVKGDRRRIYTVVRK